MGRALRQFSGGILALIIGLAPIALWFAGAGIATAIGCESYSDEGANCSASPLASQTLSVLAWLPWVGLFTLIPGVWIGMVLLSASPISLAQSRRARRRALITKFERDNL